MNYSLFGRPRACCGGCSAGGAVLGSTPFVCSRESGGGGGMDVEGDDGYHAISSGHPMNRRDAAAALPNSRLESLAKRVEELERENRLLLSRISGCPRCSKIPGSFKDDTVFLTGTGLSDGASLKAISNKELHSSKAEKPSGSFDADSCKTFTGTVINPIEEEAEPVNDVDYNCIKYGTGEELSGQQPKETHHSNKRHVALKIMYFGQRFYGFASEAQMDPTIESEIFKALQKTKLLVSKREDSNYSRCGRTDKGVSSTGQVISLYLRSNLKDGNASEGRCEIDYVKVLNRALPKDIRVMGWCPVSTSFHSRFSCLSREYKYYFWKGALDITAMQAAGKKFIGEHDFRNFCKMDAANVRNYRRQITLFEISSCSRSYDGDELWAMTICGSAFLWHQVRCMVAVLFMIGQGLESASIIDVLLDTDKIPRKPQYAMAPDLPLVLRSCEFEETKFYCSSDAWRAVVDGLNNMVRTYMLQAAIFNEALNLLPMPGQSFLGYGDKKRCHIPLISRPTEPSYDERCAKLIAKNNIRISLTSQNTVKEQAVSAIIPLGIPPAS